MYMRIAGFIMGQGPTYRKAQGELVQLVKNSFKVYRLPFRAQKAVNRQLNRLAIGEILWYSVE